MEEKHFGPVWFIPGKHSGRYPHCHSLYIEGSGVLIDPGSDRRRLKQLRTDPGVSAVWLSHWHEDHIAHLDLFEDLPLYVGEPDAQPLTGFEAFMDAYGLDTPAYRRYWRSALEKEFNFKPREPAGFLRGGDRLAMEGLVVEVIGTPGHTPGHLSYFFRGPEVLFMGDYDLSDFGPWYGDTASSIEKTIDSVENLKALPARAWITGHETGLFEQNPAQRWDRYLEVIVKREQKLLAFLDRPRTLEEIVAAALIYGRPREPKAFFEFGERALMKKHLDRLSRNGCIVSVGNRFHRRA